MEHRNREIERRLHIGRIELAGLDRMRIEAQSQVQGFFDFRDPSAHTQYRAVKMSRRNLQPLSFDKGDEGLIIRFGRAKPPGELFGRQKLAVIGTGGVVELVEQIGQRLRVAQRQPNRQVQALRGRQRAHRRQARHGGGDMPGQRLPFRRARREGEQEERSHARKGQVGPALPV